MRDIPEGAKMKEYYISSANLELVQKVKQAAKRDRISRGSDQGVNVVVVDPPVAEVQPSYAIRRGALEGKISIPDNFDTLYKEEIEKMFYGDE